jgi:hypothetical protein
MLELGPLWMPLCMPLANAGAAADTRNAALMAKREIARMGAS